MINDRERKEAEQSVIGSMILDQRCIPKVAAILTPEDFIPDIHQIIFEAAVDKSERGVLFDKIIAVDIAQTKLGDDAAKYILELVEMTPTASNAIEYAKIVKKHAGMRFLRESIGEIISDDPQEYAGDIIGICQGYLQRNVTKKTNTLKEALLSLFNEKRDGDKGLSTGYGRLDRLLKGIHKGELIIVAARPGTGKTVKAVDIAMHNTINGVQSILFSLETSKEALAERLVSRHSPLELDTLVENNMTDTEWGAFTDACGTLSKIPLEICDDPNMTVNRVRAIARSIEGLKLIVIDYLQLMTPVGKHDTQNNAIGSISRGLKLLARELEIPVIALSQLSREAGEYQKPILRNLRDSGNIEQDADKVIMLWKSEEVADGAPQPVGVFVAKNKRGKCGTFYEMFNGAHMRFTDMDENHTPPPQKARAFE